MQFTRKGLVGLAIAGALLVGPARAAESSGSPEQKALLDAARLKCIRIAADIVVQVFGEAGYRPLEVKPGDFDMLEVSKGKGGKGAFTGASVNCSGSQPSFSFFFDGKDVSEGDQKPVIRTVMQAYSGFIAPEAWMKERPAQSLHLCLSTRFVGLGDEKEGEGLTVGGKFLKSTCSLWDNKGRPATTIIVSNAE